MADDLEHPLVETVQATTMVESIKWHTYEGKEHPVGDTYPIEDAYVSSVVAQGMAIPVHRVEATPKETPS